jgi:hypothetical protein
MHGIKAGVRGEALKAKGVRVVLMMEYQSQEACLRSYMLLSGRKTREVPSAAPLG